MTTIHLLICSAQTMRLDTSQMIFLPSQDFLFFLMYGIYLRNTARVQRKKKNKQSILCEFSLSLSGHTLMSPLRKVKQISFEKMSPIKTVHQKS